MKLALKPFALLQLTLLINCGIGDEISDLDENCNTSDLTSLSKSNDISDECKDVINDFLPDPDHNLNESLYRLGMSSTDATVDIFLSLSDNSKIVDDLVGGVTIKEFSGGVESEVDVAAMDVSSAEDNGISFSSIIDYSASMSKSDTKDAISIYTDFFSVISQTKAIESNHLIFSESVFVVFDFTTSPGKEFDSGVDTERESTALLDGIGTGILSLSDRTNTIKILLVVTDGIENASRNYTFEEVVKNANRDNTTIVILGSLFSDLKFFKELTDATDGFFIYERKIISLRDQLLNLEEILSNNSYKITIPNTSADSLTLKFQNKTITYRLGQ